MPAIPKIAGIFTSKAAQIYFDCAALTLAHRARCAAAIFLRAAADSVRLGRLLLLLWLEPDGDWARTFAHRAF
jgi:hypothetical protein